MCVIHGRDMHAFPNHRLDHELIEVRGESRRFILVSALSVSRDRDIAKWKATLKLHRSIVYGIACNL